jgi:hypothetical protein
MTVIARCAAFHDPDNRFRQRVCTDERQRKDKRMNGLFNLQRIAFVLVGVIGFVAGRAI